MILMSEDLRYFIEKLLAAKNPAAEVKIRTQALLIQEVIKTKYMIK